MMSRVGGNTLEDNLSFGKMKTTLIFWKMEDDFNFRKKLKTISVLRKMEDDLNF